MFSSGLDRLAVLLVAFTQLFTSFIRAADSSPYVDPTTGVVIDDPLAFYTGHGSWSSGIVVTAVTPPPPYVSPYRLSHRFTDSLSDGDTPVSIVQTPDGSIIGVTANGGAKGVGTIFRTEPQSVLPSATLPSPSRFSIVHSLTEVLGGSTPIGNLIVDRDGVVYGTTSRGGPYNAGIVFKWSRQSGFSLVSWFGTVFSTPQSLVAPQGLTLTRDGAIYGLGEHASIYWPGNSERNYVLFKPDGMTLEEVAILPTIHLSYDTEKEKPSLVAAPNGTIYITCGGRVYRYRQGENVRPVALPDGWSLPSNLILGLDGNIHGTVSVSAGGRFAVFALHPEDDSVETIPGDLRDVPAFIPAGTSVVIPVSPEGLVLIPSPRGKPTSLTQAPDGTFYGTWSQQGGRDYIFSVLQGGGSRVLHIFDPADGVEPASLIFDGRNRVLYGILRGKGTGTTDRGAIFDFIAPLPSANQAPVAVNDRFRVTERADGTLLSANVLANDSDSDSTRIRLVSAICSTGSPVAFMADGTISMAAPTDGSSPIVIYEITDDAGGFATGRVILSNVAPIAKSDRYRVLPGDEGATLAVLDNDTDRDGDLLTITDVTSPRTGTATISSDGRQIVYKPSARFRIADSFKYTTTDQHGGSAEAEVRVVSALTNISGTYASLIGRPNSIGSVRLTVTKDLAVSGTIQFGKYLCRLSGNLDDGVANSVFRIGKDQFLSVSITVNADTDPSELDVALSDGNASISTVLARRAGFAPVDTVGNYTLEFQLATSTEAGWPDGTGYGLMTLGKNGRARLVGRLGDGFPCSAGSDLAANGKLPIFARAYRAKNWLPGGLTGTLQFVDIPESDIQGSLRWLRPITTSKPRFIFVDGVPRPVLENRQTTVNALGSRYTPISLATDKDPLWQFGAMLHMGDGELPDKVKKRFRFISEDQTEIAPVGTESINLKLDNRFGLLQGDFLHPATNSRKPIEGVILQKAQRATGLFNGAKSTGWMKIEPRD